MGRTPIYPATRSPATLFRASAAGAGSFQCCGGLPQLELQAVVQMRAERDTDDVSNRCSFRKPSAARSPMMMHGAMVLPASRAA
jgi:hypothetical protein